MTKKTLIVVAGPTASGKTGFALELAQHFNTVIISADSRQFYREISIGTAKPSDEELSLIKHFFINSHSITQPVSAGDFGTEARKLIEELFKTHNYVVMAGGSGLYIDSVINGIDALPGPLPETRAYLQQVYNDDGIETLRELLKQKDPKSFENVDIRNPRRIIRALEVTLTTGVPYSEYLGKKSLVNDWDIYLTGIAWPRLQLYERINNRVDRMFELGLKEETETVIPFKHLNALKTVGYKEMFMHLEGHLTLNETRELIAKNTRNYAKRQLTWFRRYPEMIWLNTDTNENLLAELLKSLGEKK